MSLRFAIRDDDVCFHTDAGILRELYGDISRDCPVSFSCIPFVGGFDVDGFTPEKWAQLDLQWRDWQTKEILAIDENQELVALLRNWCNDGRASIMLHGIHHDLYEFVQDKDFSADIREAKKYLDELFAQAVTVASSPNNSLGPSSTRALASNGFNVLTAFGHLPGERPASVRNYLNFLRLLYLYFRYGKRYRLTLPLNFGSHSEQPCYEIGPSTRYDELVEGFEFALERGGNFVVATHYYHLSANPALHTMLTSLVSLAKKRASGSIQFVTAERLFESS
ncbi:MAG: hypothetical protein OEY01_16225 [Desulfobulbaceae bacterium]|nr:hypothetical protein [Desulfobulbaceae bacterium]